MTKEDFFEFGQADGAHPLQDLAFMGMNELAYVRKLDADMASRLFPEVQDLPEDLSLFAAFAADGSPLFLSSSMPAILAETMSRDLALVQLH